MTKRMFILLITILGAYSFSISQIIIDLTKLNLYQFESRPHGFYFSLPYPGEEIFIKLDKVKESLSKDFVQIDTIQVLKVGMKYPIDERYSQFHLLLIFADFVKYAEQSNILYEDGSKIDLTISDFFDLPVKIPKGYYYGRSKHKDFESFYIFPDGALNRDCPLDKLKLKCSPQNKAGELKCDLLCNNSRIFRFKFIPLANNLMYYWLKNQGGN